MRLKIGNFCFSVQMNSLKIFCLLGIFQVHCSLEKMPLEIYEKFLKMVVQNAILDSKYDSSVVQRHLAIENDAQRLFVRYCRDDIYSWETSYPRDYKSVICCGGVKIDLRKKKVLFDHLSSLSCVSQLMNRVIKHYMPSICEDWFANRGLLNLFSEGYFQSWFKSKYLIKDDSQTPYLKICEKFYEKNFHFHFHFDRSGPEFKLFLCVPNFFICFATCKLSECLSWFKEKGGHINDLDKKIFDLFFEERAYSSSPLYQGGVFKNDYSKNFVFLLACSLGFLEPGFHEEGFLAIDNHFKELKELFEILVSDSDGFIEQKNMLNSMPSFLEPLCNDQLCKKIILPRIEAIIKCLFHFNKLLTRYDEEYYKDFSCEQKLIFLYCKLMINQEGYRKNLKAGFYFQCGIWEKIWQLWSPKIKRYIDTLCPGLLEADLALSSNFDPLLSIMLKLYKIDQFFSYLKSCSDINSKIEELYFCYPNLSFNHVAENLPFLSQTNWKEGFKQLANPSSDCKDVHKDLIKKLILENSALKNELNHVISENKLLKAHVQGLKNCVQEYRTMFENFWLKISILKKDFESKIFALDENFNSKISRLAVLAEVLVKKIQQDAASHDKELNRLKQGFCQWKKLLVGSAVFLCIICSLNIPQKLLRVFLVE